MRRLPGVESPQWFVGCDFQQHYFTLFEDAPETHAELARIAQFDCVATSTVLKSGQVLRGDDGAFAASTTEGAFPGRWKLRTVIWDFAGDLIPESSLAEIVSLEESAATPTITVPHLRVHRML